MKLIWYIIGKLYNLYAYKSFHAPIACDPNYGLPKGYKPKNSMKRHFINTCSLSYECPLAWEDLEGKDKIRHCNECNKDVFWCDNEADFERHAAKQNCVAFLLSNNPEPLLGVPAEPGFGKLLKKSDTNTWAIIILGIIVLKMVKGILTSYYG